jgi:hypothetical protein
MAKISSKAHETANTVHDPDEICDRPTIRGRSSKYDARTSSANRGILY